MNGDVSSYTKTFINDPPDTPAVPRGNTNVEVGTANTYSSAASDPEEDQISYTFDWGDGNTTTTGLYNSGTTVMETHTWDTNGTFDVRVTATDSFGADSGSSGPLEVVVLPLTQDRLPIRDARVAGRWKEINCGGGGDTTYQCVDDPIGSPNNGIDYITIRDRKGKPAIFRFAPFTIPSGATINFVRVTFVARAHNGRANMKAALVLGRHLYTAPKQVLSSAWATYNADWTKNPRTGGAWKVADINGSYFKGVGVKSGNGDQSLTQVYVTVHYLP